MWPFRKEETRRVQQDKEISEISKEIKKLAEEIKERLDKPKYKNGAA